MPPMLCWWLEKVYGIALRRVVLLLYNTLLLLLPLQLDFRYVLFLLTPLFCVCVFLSLLHIRALRASVVCLYVYVFGVFFVLLLTFTYNNTLCFDLLLLFCFCFYCQVVVIVIIIIKLFMLHVVHTPNAQTPVLCM